MVVAIKAQKHIWGLFAGRCAMCRETVIEDSGIARALIGEVAHIAGARPGAARYDPSMSDEERDDPENLVLLCRKHHKIIDDNETAYSVEKIREIRAAFLAWLNQQLANSAPWRLKISGFTYLNVPRLIEYATLQGYQLRTPTLPPSGALHDLRYDLVQVMRDFERPLESMAIQSISAGEIDFAHEGYVGQILNFDRLSFRTKNIPAGIPDAGGPPKFTGNLELDAHIYHRFAGWTLVFNIDYRWITTSTAFVLFRPTGGSSLFTGFGRVTAVDLENRRMFGTALALGTPQSQFDLVMQGQSPHTAQVNFQNLEDDLTKSRKGQWLSELENCDFCGRSFSGEEYMVDGPMREGAPWGCMCGECYSKARLPLGVGKGQLYRRVEDKWRMVGGYPRPLEDEQD